MSYVFLTKKNKNPHTKFEIQRKPKGPPLGAVSLKETLKKKKKKATVFLTCALEIPIM